MYCNNCGKQIPDGSRFCTYCGQPVSSKKQIKEDIPHDVPEEEKSLERDNSVIYKWLVNIALYASVLYLVLLLLAHTSYEVSVEQKEGGVSGNGTPIVNVNITVCDKLSKGKLSLGFCSGFHNYDCDSFIVGQAYGFYRSYTKQELDKYGQTVVDGYKSCNLAWIIVFALVSVCLYFLRKYLLKHRIIV